MKIDIDKSGRVEVTDALATGAGAPILDQSGQPQRRAWSFDSLRDAMRQLAEFPADVQAALVAAFNAAEAAAAKK